MIGQLPTSLEIGGISYKINADFRNILNIFAAFNDPELTEQEKCFICIFNLFEDLQSIPQEHLQTAINRAYWFVSGGNSMQTENAENAKIIDWEQDEFLFFPAINKVAGFEVRTAEFMHRWTFLGYFGEIGEGLFSQVLHIRTKRASGKKLEKWEEEFYRKNRNLIKIKEKYSKEELEEREKINALFN